MLESNQQYADQLLDSICWNDLNKSQQQNIHHLLEAVTSAVKQNLSLLDISSKGNKKLMDLYFNKVKLKPVFYTSSGKLFKNSYAPSLGMQHMA